MSLTQFLQFVGLGGGSVAVVSFIAEQVAAFQALSANAKRNYSFLASAVLALAAWGVVTYVPTGTLDVLNTPFLIVGGIFAVYFLGQAFHFTTKQ